MRSKKNASESDYLTELKGKYGNQIFYSFILELTFQRKSFQQC